MSTDRARFARDFFFELMKDSQRLRAGFLAERERWLRSLAVDGREEILFEFEMLLRGLERFFNLHNLPLDDDGPVVARDFGDELSAVRDAVNRCIRLARFLLDPPSDRRLVFRKYLETRVTDERVRRELIEAELEQSTPQESLFLLRQGFVALRGVLDQLQRLDGTGYQLFADVGQLALWHIALNKHFKPFRPLEFRPEYDRIKNVKILELGKTLEAPAKRPVSTAFLALFRLLHYLRYVPGPNDVATRRAQVVLALVRSEIASLTAFLEGDLAACLTRLGPEKSAAAIRIAQEVRAETSRVVKQDLGATGAPSGAPGRAREDLSKMCRKAVTDLACIFNPSLEVSSLFDAASERHEQARRLRLDLFAYREVCAVAEQALAAGGGEAEAARALAALKAFALYFRDVSYQLLRYADFEPFERFAAIVQEPDALPAGPARARLAEDCRVFGAMAEKTFGAVCRREEIAREPFDQAEGKRLAERFLKDAPAAPAPAPAKP